MTFTLTHTMGRGQGQWYTSARKISVWNKYVCPNMSNPHHHVSTCYSPILNTTLPTYYMCSRMFAIRCACLFIHNHFNRIREWIGKEVWNEFCWPYSFPFKRVENTHKPAGILWRSRWGWQTRCHGWLSWSWSRWPRRPGWWGARQSCRRWLPRPSGLLI